MNQFINFLTNIDNNLVDLFKDNILFAYIIIFLIIFTETAFIIVHFLPGDTLLMGLGMLISNDLVNGYLLTILLIIAAFCGTQLNYYIGIFIGEHLLKNKYIKKIIKEESLNKSHEYFNKYGNKSIAIARFIPLIRSLIPFLAGISKMNHKKFTIYNLIGAFLWILTYLLIGYIIGLNPIFQKYFNLIVTWFFIILFISMIIWIIKLIIDLILTKEKVR